MSGWHRFLILVGSIGVLVSADGARAQSWPDLYNPFAFHTVRLWLDTQDWNTILHDQTYNIEVPADLSLNGEPPLLVAVRRKSATALPSESNPVKISLKVDINEYVPGQTWHGVKKISLENGDDNNVVTEGFAWYLHRLAWVQGGYPYMPGLGCWVRLYVNDVYKGVYVHVEQVDKQFLENRNLWADNTTWLYKASDVRSNTLEFGIGDSPTYTTLCYAPFPVQSCATPEPGAFAAQVASLVEMQGMLTQGAANAFMFSPDALFSKGKNFFYADFQGSQRHYYSWDLDSNFGPLRTNASIYELGNSDFEDLVLDNPVFRAQYDQIMRRLVQGPYQAEALTTALNLFEAQLTDALLADPHNQLPGGPASAFQQLRNWVPGRIANVLGQLPTPDPSAAGPLRTQPLAVFPNPAVESTTIAFELTVAATVDVGIYDLRGRLVRQLARGAMPAGRHALQWNGTNEGQVPVAAGRYYLVVRRGDVQQTQGLTVLAR